MSERLTPWRDPSTLEPEYSRYVEAMTEEGIHHKATFAAQLAYRDREIATLRAELAAEKEHSARLYEALENARERAGRRCAPHEAAIRLQGIRADCNDALADPSTAALLRRREAEQAVIDAARYAIAEPEYWALRREPLGESLAALDAETDGKGRP